MQPEQLRSGRAHTCTATVEGVSSSATVATGTVTFKISTIFSGTFSNGGKCKLVSGSCSVVFTPSEEQVGTVPMMVTYNGDGTHYTSSGSTEIFISGN